ncbi:MAG: DegV family protein [Anaerolineales bacterium]
MPISIVTDSTCDLPLTIVTTHDIAVVPLYINIAGESYLDGVDISREEFYARLPDLDPAPTTAAPGPQRFVQIYDGLAAEGATEILSIHISEELSAVPNVARLAAREASVPVTVLDSRSLSMGTGFLAWRAAEAAAEGKSMEKILALLEEQIQRTFVFAALDTLEFLRRSGRMNRPLALVGEWLQMKPLLTMHDGAPKVQKVRTTDHATERLVDLLRDWAPLEKAALVHTHALERAEELREKTAHMLPEDTLSVDITPIFGVHLGPGAVGFACVTAQQKE